MRKKVQLAYITCDSARKSTFKKRKKGLLKKIDELSTLCGVDACAVIYSPYEPTPDVWPNREQAHKVVTDFRQLPEMDQNRKMFDHPSYLKHRRDKSSQQLARQVRENREKEVTLAMYGYLAGQLGLEGLSMMDLNDLNWVVDRSLKEIALRLEGIQRKNKNVMVAPHEAPAPQGGEVGPGLGLGLGFGFGQFFPEGPVGFDAGASTSGSGSGDGALN